MVTAKLHTVTIKPELCNDENKIKEILSGYDRRGQLKGYLGKHVYLFDMSKEDEIAYKKHFRVGVFNISSTDTATAKHKKYHHHAKSKTCKLYINDDTEKHLLLNKLGGMKGVRVHVDDPITDNIIEVTFENARQRHDNMLNIELMPGVIHIECLQPVRPSNTHAYNIIYHVVDAKEVLLGEKYVYGEGDIVTVIDTGLDTTHCLFADSRSGAGVAYYDLSKLNVGDLKSSLEEQGKHKVIYGYASLSYKNSRKNTDKKDAEHGHGTHTSGSVMLSGDCTSEILTTSFLPKHRLFFIDVQRNTPLLTDKEGKEEEEEEHGQLDLPGSFNWILEAIKSINSNIVSCSFGSSNSTMYSILSYEVDTFMYDNPHISIVFAAGNDGPGRGTISSPGDAKNVITVGASSNTMQSFLEYANMFKVQQNYTFDVKHIHLHDAFYKEHNLADFSSRGPTFDGRIKPDVVAPGSFILSADATLKSKITPHENMLLMRGTSMATPLIANTLTMINTVLHRKYKETDITNELRKAILVAFSSPLIGYEQSWSRSAESPTMLLSKLNMLKRLDIYDYGHGKVQLGKMIAEGFAYAKGALRTTSEPFTACYLPPDFQVDNLRASLVYNDPPSFPGSVKILVNDLNLRILHIDSDTFDILGVYEGNGKLDSINNVEVVDISRVTLNEMIVAQVGAKDIISGKKGHQTFSIAFNVPLQQTSCPSLSEMYSDLLLPTQCFAKTPNTLGMLHKDNNTCVEPIVYTVPWDMLNSNREQKRELQTPVLEIPQWDSIPQYIGDGMKTNKDFDKLVYCVLIPVMLVITAVNLINLNRD